MRRMIILRVLYLLRTKYVLSKVYFKQNYLIYFICSNVAFEILAAYLVEMDYSNKYIDNILMVQGGSNMTGTDLYVNKPHCAESVRP